MIEMIDTADDQIAFRISHKVTGTDLDAIMDRLEAVLAAHDKVHLFIETHALDGIELSGLARYTRRAMPLFGKLGRFDRVAVVADQPWVRIATRLESALVPFITYRTFVPDQRDEALAWVKGNP